MRRGVALALALLLCLACSRPDIPDFYGVRLGMVPRDVRDRSSLPEGRWESQLAGDDYSVTWFGTGVGADAPTRATFEFHMGSLVAVRSDLPPSAALANGDAVIVSKSAVLHRGRAGDHVHLDLLARDCPTHAAEAKRIVEDR